MQKNVLIFILIPPFNIGCLFLLSISFIINKKYPFLKCLSLVLLTTLLIKCCLLTSNCNCGHNVIKILDLFNFPKVKRYLISSTKTLCMSCLTSCPTIYYLGPWEIRKSYKKLKVDRICYSLSLPEIKFVNGG